MNEENKISEKQERFMWMAHIEGKRFIDIAEHLNVKLEHISQWEKDLKPHWEKLSELKKLYNSKKLNHDIEIVNFQRRLEELSKDKRCRYCQITETELTELFEKYNDPKNPLTKRNRGRKLELDRMEPNEDYNNLDNLVFACYWCNNAKTDTFTEEEFKPIGEEIKKVWKKRLEKK